MLALSVLDLHRENKFQRLACILNRSISSATMCIEKCHPKTPFAEICVNTQLTLADRCDSKPERMNLISRLQNSGSDKDGLKTTASMFQSLSQSSGVCSGETDQMQLALASKQLLLSASWER